MKALLTLFLRLLARLSPKKMFDLIKMQMGDRAPFIRHVGVTIDSIGTGIAQTSMPDLPHLKNHIGTAHAAATFMLCETASGAAMAGAFIPVLLQVRPVVRDARIAFLKSGRGPLQANAKLCSDASELLEKLDKAGYVEFEIAVEAKTAEGTVVASATYVWNVKKGDTK